MMHHRVQGAVSVHQLSAARMHSRDALLSGCAHIRMTFTAYTAQVAFSAISGNTYPPELMVVHE